MKIPARAGGLLLGAALASLVACKPSSLAPFTGYRGEEQPQIPNGSYTGTTSAGKTVSFLIASGAVSNLSVEIAYGSCLLVYTNANTFPITNGSFHIDSSSANGDHVVVDASVLPDDSWEGSYNALTIGPRVGFTCPLTASGTFTATLTQ